MGDRSNISWTMATWNPWRGCRKVSPGCKNCYMFRDQTRYGQDPSIVTRSKTTFNAPLKWKEPTLIFTCSWSDWFIEEADAWRAEAWDIIRRTPHHTYQILTKRPERMVEHLPADWGDGWSNVWMGVSVESQQYADKRIPELLEIPARVRFLSVEPMLGPIDFTQIPTGHWAYGHVDVMSGYLCGNEPDEMRDWDADPQGWIRKPAGEWERGPHGVDWVIVGGESGPGFRPLNLDHARSVRDQCVAAGVPFFFKQDSGPRPGMNPMLDGVVWNQLPNVNEGGRE